MSPLNIGNVRDQIPLADATEFSLDVYRETGFFVVRDLIPGDQIEEWQEEWKWFYKERLIHRDVDPFNPVNVSVELPPKLAAMHKCESLLDVMQLIYPNLALFMQRFIIKDHKSREAVFAHQDFCYDFGWPEKTTVFIPLSISNSENGGISFYPGTHHLGYLGDAGQVNVDILGPEWPLICPSLEPGDIAMIHTCTWHCSPRYISGPDRILSQATFQPASDPSSAELLRGDWQVRYRLRDIPRDKFFVRSRASRLRELQAQLDRSESGAKSA